MELALLEDSFEASIRGYTKLIDTYAKCNSIESTETAFQAMKSEGFPCDQVTLTVLVKCTARLETLTRPWKYSKRSNFLVSLLTREHTARGSWHLLGPECWTSQRVWWKRWRRKKYKQEEKSTRLCWELIQLLVMLMGLRECLTPFSLQGLSLTASSALFL